MSDLKPCPFCGSGPKQNGEFDEIWCPNPECWTSEIDACCMTKDKWNRRDGGEKDELDRYKKALDVAIDELTHLKYHESVTEALSEINQILGKEEG